MHVTSNRCQLFFRSWIDFFEYDRKNLGQFGHHVRKGSLVNAVTASLNTTMGQMTEMSQRKMQR